MKWRYWIPMVLLMNGAMIIVSILFPGYWTGFITGALILDTVNIFVKKMEEYPW